MDNGSSENISKIFFFFFFVVKHTFFINCSGLITPSVNITHNYEGMLEMESTGTIQRVSQSSG